MNQDLSRYSRQIKLSELGEEGQKKLAQAKVLIIGVGGLGCPVATYLVAAGVGKIGLMDADRVEVSNLHRQVLFKENDLGEWKVDAAKKALTSQNSEVEITCYNESLTPENALIIFADYDLIIDGTDNFPSKYLINDACLLSNKPWVYASIYKFEGQLSVFNFQKGPSYRCLFPTLSTKNLSCEETGVLGALPGVLGSLQAAEALKLILGIGDPLSGKLKMINLLSMDEQIIRFTKKEAEIEKAISRPLIMETLNCQLKDKYSIYLDVREVHEQPRPTARNIISIPLKELKFRVKEIPKSEKVHVFCQSGIRSEKAIHLLREEFNYQNLINVPGGISSIIL